jgi:membrane protein implicated in regulation of membrane protease activity
MMPGMHTLGAHLLRMLSALADGFSLSPAAMETTKFVVWVVLLVVAVVAAWHRFGARLDKQDVLLDTIGTKITALDAKVEKTCESVDRMRIEQAVQREKIEAQERDREREKDNTARLRPQPGRGTR